tara:strand:- start:3825 stop:4307 length:483 start_codon:yes stop_codon:yes gene_type:complete
MSVHQNRKAIIYVTATTDAEQINQNKVVAQSIEIPNAVDDAGGASKITSLSLIDETNSTMECDIVFSGLATAISGDEGKAVGEDVSDLDTTISKMLGSVSIASGDYTDMIDSRLATKSGIDLIVQAATGSTSIYMHIINRGSAVTFGETNDVKVNIGLEY